MVSAIGSVPNSEDLGHRFVITFAVTAVVLDVDVGGNVSIKSAITTALGLVGNIRIFTVVAIL